LFAALQSNHLKFGFGLIQLGDGDRIRRWTLLVRTKNGYFGKPFTSEQLLAFDAPIMGKWVKSACSKVRPADHAFIQVSFTLIIVGVILCLINRFIPMAGSIKSILNAVVVICVVMWLLNVFGLLHSLSRVRVG
jgi:hypothetical protein